RAFPVTARIPHVQMDVLSGMRPAVERHHPRLVDHLVADDDVSGALEDLDAVAVDDRKNRADDPSRDAAIVVAVVLVRVRLAVAQALDAPLGEAPLTFGRHRWNSAI